MDLDFELKSIFNMPPSEHPGRKPMVGLRFGKLRVIDFVEMRNGDAYYLCKCDCGNAKTIRGSSLSVGNTKSCGCMKNRYYHNMMKEVRI